MPDREKRLKPSDGFGEIYRRAYDAAHSSGVYAPPSHQIRLLARWQGEITGRSPFRQQMAADVEHACGVVDGLTDALMEYWAYDPASEPYERTIHRWFAQRSSRPGQ